MIEGYNHIETKDVPKSPLSSLRLSNSDFKDINADKKRNKARRDLRLLSIKHNVISESTKTKDGFEPELTLAQISLNNIVNKDKAEMKKVSEVATILLDTRKTFQADCNIVDPKEGNTQGDKNKNIGNKDNASAIEISRTTLIRSEKVKSMIGLKYLFIQRIHERAESDNVYNKYKGVIGVYNPLQVLRNRKIRKKYKEHPAPLSVRTLPLASNVFSIHNKDQKKPWKMYWSIDLDEFIGDLSWRTGHWNELKNSKGKLWFPPSNSSTSPNNKSKKQRLHDRIFSDGGSDSGIKIDSIHSSATSLSTDDNKPVFKLHKRKAIKKKLKKGVGKFYDRNTSSDESISFSVPSTSNISSNTLPKGKKGNQLLVESTSSNTDLEPHLELVRDNSEDQSETIADEKNSELNINEVSFKPVDRTKSEELQLTTEHIEEVQPSINEDIGKEEFNRLMDNFMYIERVVSLRLYYLLKVYPRLMQLSNSKINEIMQQQIPIIFRNMVLINDDHLPQYEELYNGLSGEIKSVIRMVNTDYSIRIDKLLSNSDRCIGEINTSLSLELRKVNEKLDNLNSLLFRNIVTTSFSTDPTMKLKHGANNNRLVYFILENFIVVMLRLVWVIVNMYKLVMTILRSIFKIVKYLLC